MTIVNDCIILLLRIIFIIFKKRYRGGIVLRSRQKKKGKPKMKKLPDLLVQAWEKREGPLVLSTVSNDKQPNAIYATCVSLFEDNTILVADNYLNKTKQNVLDGSYGSALFISDEYKSFQLKGPLQYVTEGRYFQNMKTWNPDKHPGKGVVVLKIEQAFSGAEKIL